MVSWSFSGVRANGEISAWSLRFYFDSRTFKTRAIKSKAHEKYAGQMAQKDLLTNLPEVARAEVIDALVTPILQARLSDEQVANAMRHALLYRRR